ncbi:serine protease [Saccharothrix sp. Mg75]|uniref:serine protease n=1 Tax=Saccharothrix sp. Mg75 TaxID=3445357 RepID=UPI003EECD3FB
MTWDRRTSARDLFRAIDALDRPRVAALCAELVEHLRVDERPYPLDQAHRVLGELRRKRCFAPLREVADAFLQSGEADPTIRRQYAQALLDQGVLTAAVAVLERLLEDVAASPYEATEARGLLGRAYKQMYVATAPSAPRRRRRLLELAVGHYRRVYDQAGLAWHGINLVALLVRARRDGVDLPGDPVLIARNVLAATAGLGHAAGVWDHGTALEACVALGRHDEAVERLHAYLGAGADAFEIAGTLRQLQDVWELDTSGEPGLSLLPVLAGALLDRRPAGGVSVGPAEMRDEVLDRLDHLQKLLGDDGFQTLGWFRTALERCRAVALVEDPVDGGVGTGFLVDGKALHPSCPDVVLVTNAHVVSADHPQALHPDRALVTFRALEGGPGHRIRRVLWSSPVDRLDVTVAELDGVPAQATRCPPARRRPVVRADEATRAYVIGHPRGREQVMLSVQDNRLLDADDTRLHYRTPTERGSSGSPVFNRQWDLIAIHHAGGERMARLNGHPGLYPANEGIWFDRVRQELSRALDAARGE